MYIYDYLDMKSILEQLSSMTVVVADTGDLDSIKKFQPRDATTNPSLILAAAKNPDYVKLIDKALESSENALPQGFSEIELIKETVDQVSVFFGKEILKIISGRVSTEVDARLSFDTEATVEKARKLVLPVFALCQSNIRPTNGEIRVIFALAQVTAWQKLKSKVKLHLIPSFSKISAALIPSQVAAILIKILSFSIPKFL